MTEDDLYFEQVSKEKKEGEELEEYADPLTIWRREKEEITQRLNGVDSKIDFMLKRMHVMVKEEVRVKLSEEGFKQFAVKLITDEMRNNFPDYVKKVIDLTLSNMGKRIKAEVQISKELIGSLNSDIKRVVRNIPVSYEYEKRIEEEITKKMNNICSDISKNLIEESKEVKYLEGS